MLKLMLLRHAKSRWDAPGIADIDRGLNDRGQSDALAMGRHIASLDGLPDLVLCSPARRARDTWAIVDNELKMKLPVQFEPAIYDFSDGMALLEFVRGNGGAARSLMLVGHNPSLEGLAKLLVTKGNGKLRRRMETKYPTSALAVISLDADSWPALARGNGALLGFVGPKDVGESKDGLRR